MIGMFFYLEVPNTYRFRLGIIMAVYYCQINLEIASVFALSPALEFIPRDKAQVGAG